MIHSPQPSISNLNYYIKLTHRGLDIRTLLTHSLQLMTHHFIIRDMWEHLSGKGPLPTGGSKEVLRRTANYQVTVDLKNGDIDERAFFIDPITEAGVIILQKAAIAHNIYNFELRSMPYRLNGVVQSRPSLRIDYLPSNVPALFEGRVEIPEVGESTVPSIDRMEECLPGEVYTFREGLLPNYSIPNPHSRRLRMLQRTHLDDVPQELINSNSANPYYKVRKGWWLAIIWTLNKDIRGELKDHSLDQAVDSFKSQFSGDFLLARRLTTSEDISVANRVLDQIWDSQAK